MIPENKNNYGIVKIRENVQYLKKIVQTSTNFKNTKQRNKRTFSFFLVLLQL